MYSSRPSKTNPQAVGPAAARRRPAVTRRTPGVSLSGGSRQPSVVTNPARFDAAGAGRHGARRLRKGRRGPPSAAGGGRLPRLTCFPVSWLLSRAAPRGATRAGRARRGVARALRSTRRDRPGRAVAAAFLQVPGAVRRMGPAVCRVATRCRAGPPRRIGLRATDVWSHGSVEERSVHTGKVTGSIPVGTTIGQAGEGPGSLPARGLFCVRARPAWT